jgi:hypothetical protein
LIYEKIRDTNEANKFVQGKLLFILENMRNASRYIPFIDIWSLEHNAMFHFILDTNSTSVNQLSIPQQYRNIFSTFTKVFCHPSHEYAMVI